MRNLERKFLGAMENFSGAMKTVVNKSYSHYQLIMLIMAAGFGNYSFHGPRNLLSKFLMAPRKSSHGSKKFAL